MRLLFSFPLLFLLQRKFTASGTLKKPWIFCCYGNQAVSHTIYLFFKDIFSEPNVHSLMMHFFDETRKGFGKLCILVKILVLQFKIYFITNNTNNLDIIIKWLKTVYCTISTNNEFMLQYTSRVIFIPLPNVFKA